MSPFAVFNPFLWRHLFKDGIKQGEINVLQQLVTTSSLVCVCIPLMESSSAHYFTQCTTLHCFGEQWLQPSRVSTSLHL